MEHYVPNEGDRVFVPFGEAHDRAGERGTVASYAPKETQKQMEARFAADPYATPPVPVLSVLFDDEIEPEDVDLSRVRPYAFRPYFLSYLAMRARNPWPILFKLAVAAGLIAAVWYGSTHRQPTAPATPAQADLIIKLGRLESEAALRRSDLLSVQRDLKIRLADNIDAVKAEDAKIAGYRAAALKAVNAPKEAPKQ